MEEERKNKKARRGSSPATTATPPPVTIYHERQRDEARCGQHALNNLVQQLRFSFNALMGMAIRLEVWRVHELKGKAGDDHLEQPPKNLSPSGDFSIQVIETSLEKGWRGLKLEHFMNQELNNMDGFLIYTGCRHWIAIRRVNGNYWNLDSKNGYPVLVRCLETEIGQHVDDGDTVLCAITIPPPLLDEQVQDKDVVSKVREESKLLGRTLNGGFLLGASSSWRYYLPDAVCPVIAGFTPNFLHRLEQDETEWTHLLVRTGLRAIEMECEADNALKFEMATTIYELEQHPHGPKDFYFERLKSQWLDEPTIVYALTSYGTAQGRCWAALRFYHDGHEDNQKNCCENCFTTVSIVEAALPETNETEREKGKKQIEAYAKLLLARMGWEAYRLETVSLDCPEDDPYCSAPLALWVMAQGAWHARKGSENEFKKDLVSKASAGEPRKEMLTFILEAIQKARKTSSIRAVDGTNIETWNKSFDMNVALLAGRKPTGLTDDTVDSDSEVGEESDLL